MISPVHRLFHRRNRTLRKIVTRSSLNVAAVKVYLWTTPGKSSKKIRKKFSILAELMPPIRLPRFIANVLVLSALNRRGTLHPLNIIAGKLEQQQTSHWALDHERNRKPKMEEYKNQNIGRSRDVFLVVPSPPKTGVFGGLQRLLSVQPFLLGSKGLVPLQPLLQSFISV